MTEPIEESFWVDVPRQISSSPAQNLTLLLHLRAPAQGACPYANICEHCPSFRAEPGSLPILAAQRGGAAALARDAEQRGLIAEAGRHYSSSHDSTP